MDNKDSLIDRIEEVKSKIVDFENDLNINFIDINKVARNQNQDLINQINDYKDRINSIEQEVSKEKLELPAEEKPLLSNDKISSINPVGTKITNENSYNDLKNSINKVEMEKQEIDDINNLLEKLKKNVAEQKKANVYKASVKTKIESKISDNTDKPVQKINMTAPIKPIDLKNDTVANTNNKPSNFVNKPVQQIKITENDLHSMSELISKLDGLLRSNKEIADKLGELLKEEKQTYSPTSKSNELIKKLAILGSSGNLSQI